MGENNHTNSSSLLLRLMCVLCPHAARERNGENGVKWDQSRDKMWQMLGKMWEMFGKMGQNVAILGKMGE